MINERVLEADDFTGSPILAAIITASLRHCVTASLRHCVTASLRHCVTASLRHYFFLTAFLRYGDLGNLTFHPTVLQPGGQFITGLYLLGGLQ